MFFSEYQPFDEQWKCGGRALYRLLFPVDSTTDF